MNQNLQESKYRVTQFSVSNESFNSAEADHSEFPEGGRGWLVIAGVFCMSAMTYGMINSYGAYVTHYQSVFPNTSSITINWIGSLQTFLCYFIAPFSFPIVSTFGPRITTFVGGIFMMTSFFILSSCKNIWQIYLCQGLLYGFGAGICFASSLVAPYEWFKKRRALAIGVSVAGTSFGGIFATLILKQMIPNQGFKWANITIGFFFLPLVICSTCLVQQKMPEKYLANKPSCIANVSPSLESTKKLPNRYLSMFQEWKTVVQDSRLLLLLLSNCFGMMGSYPSIFYIDYYASLIAPETKLAEYSIIIWNVCGGVGRVACTFLADRYGRLNTLAISIFLCFLFPIALWMPSKPGRDALYALFIVLYSLSCAGFFSIFPSTMGQIFGIKCSESRINLFSLTSSLGPLAGGAIAGSFIPIGSQSSLTIISAFSKLIAYTCAVMLASLMVLIFLRFQLSRNWKAFV